MIPTNRDLQELLYGCGLALAGWGIGSLAPLPNGAPWLAMALGLAFAVIGTIGFIRSVSQKGE